MIPQSQIDEIIERNDIVSVVSEYVKLTRKGGNDWGLCPFHNEKTASFSVNESKQIFKCFGCGKGGNVIHFIMLAESLDYVGAIEFLANRVGIRIRYDGKGPDDEKLKLKNDILSLNKTAARFFYENLKKSVVAQEYFKRRGIPVEIVKKFGLGFANDSWGDLLKFCTEGALALKPEFLLQAGLVLKSEEKSRYYDRFRNRVMFPIFDVSGNVIAFGGRVLDDSKPKYLNSPENPAYSKGYHLYGLNFARKANSKRVIIVEGYMDCIALHQKGICWAVASLGTALTQNQARLLKRYFDEVLIGYDADGAGQNATIRGLDILAAQGLRVKVLDLSVVDGKVKDPDEFLRVHTADDFMKVVDKAKSLVSFKIEKLAQEFPPDSPASKVEFLNRAAMIIGKEPTASARAHYIQEVSNQYGADREALRQDVESVSGGKTLQGLQEDSRVRSAIKTPVQAKKEAETQVLSKTEIEIDKLEKRLILCLSDNVREFTKFMQGKAYEFLIPDNLELYQKLVARHTEGQGIGRDAVLASASLDGAADVMKAWDAAPEGTPVSEILDRLNRCSMLMRRQTLMKRMADAEDMQEKRKLMEEIHKLDVASKGTTQSGKR
ncbi:MAG: DNA primase [Clostridia bacterium]|nr:DNA primase [Clostridia bacterium]